MNQTNTHKGVRIDARCQLGRQNTVRRTEKNRGRSVAFRGWASALLLLAVGCVVAFAGCADQSSPSSPVPNVEAKIDGDGDRLIDIVNLDRLSNIRYNLAGTSYKTSAADAGKICGVDGTVACIGYELIKSLDFADGASYASGTVHGAWQPNVSNNPAISTNAGWAPIGDSAASFAAIFEGNGNSISNLYARGNRSVGLFGRVSGTVRNFIAQDGAVYSGTGIGDIGSESFDNNDEALAAAGGAVDLGGSVAVGIIAGAVDIGGKILSSAAVGGSATGGSAQNAFVGALVGLNNGIITASYAASLAKGGTGNGGNIGILVGRNNGTITAGYAFGVAIGGSGNADRVGALVGQNHNGTILASYATGSADGGVGVNDAVGALVGFSSGGKIGASYAFGSVIGNESAGDPAGAPHPGSPLPNGSDGNPIQGVGGLTADNTRGCTDPTRTTETACSSAGGTWIVWSVVADRFWDFGDSTNAPGLTYGTGQGTLIPGQDAALRPFALLTAPVNLRTVSTNRKVTLAWDRIEGATSYHIYRQATGESDTTIVAISIAITHTESTLTNGIEYTYTVRAVNLAGEGAVSSGVIATPLATPDTPLITTHAGDGQVTIKWARVVGASEYYVYRSTDGDPLLRLATGTTIAADEYVDTTVSNSTAYAYTVRAINVNGARSVDSHRVMATPLAAPSAPTDLEANPEDGQVRLTWRAALDAGAGSDPYHYYHLYRVIGSGGGMPTSADRIRRINTSSSTVSYTDSGVSNGTQYTYIVRSINSNDTESSDSNSGSVTPRIAPAAPTLTLTSGNKEIAVGWNRVDNATEYRVYRTGTANPITTVTQTSAISYTYANTDLTNDTEYTYTVRAVNVDVEGAASSAASATPRAVLAVPATFTATAGDAQVTLLWSRVNSATAYRVYRTGMTNPITTVTQTSAVTYTYADTGLTNDTEYTYTVRAMNTDVESFASSAASATPRTAPGAVTFTVTAGDAQVILSWSRVTGATAYRIYRMDKLGQIHETIADNGDATYTYTDTGLRNGATQLYFVTAVNHDVGGPGSPYKVVTPRAALDAPATFTATAGDAQVTLSWSRVAGATAYRVYRTRTTNPITTVTQTSDTTYSYANTSLANGTEYTYTVRTVNRDVEGAASSAASATPRTAPAAPATFTVTAGDAQVTLSWSRVTGTTEYRVYRAGTANPITTVTQASDATFTYANTGLTNDTEYTYTVRAVNRDVEGAASSAASTTPRAVPAAVILTATAGGEQVTLSWDTVINATDYRIYRAGTTNSIATIPQTISVSYIYANTGLTNGTEYTYTIRAVNTDIEGAASNAVSATPRPAPAAVTFTVTAGDAQVTLSWSRVTGATAYRIYRLDKLGQIHETIADNGDATYTFIDTGLRNGATKLYFVTAVNQDVAGPGSPYKFVTPRAALAAPATFTATAGDAQVTLSWSRVTGATAYRVYRTGTTNPITTVTQSSAVTFTYANTGLTNGTEYTYTVRAVNNGVEGTASSVAAATPRAALAAPATFTATAGDAQVTLSWRRVTSATAYRVYRTGTASPITTVTQGGAISYSYADTGLTNGTEYTYTVRAVNTDVEGAASSAASATPRIAPVTLTATPGDGEVTLSWNKIDGATEYRVYRTGTANPITTVTQTSAVSYTYADTGVTNGTQYTYTVRAVNGGVEGVASNFVHATPRAALAAPATFTATPGDTRVTLLWSIVAGATDYRVYRVGTVNRIASIAASYDTTYTYSNAGLTNDTEYTYTVRAVNRGVEGAASSAASATPRITPVAPTLTATPGDGEVTLSWNRVDHATEYRVYRSGTTNPITTITQSSAVSYTYADTGITNGTEYTYTVRAVNRGVQGAPVSLTTASSVIPGIPSNFGATGGDGEVALAWDAITDPNAGTVTYRIYRVVGSGTPTSADRIATGTTIGTNSYTDTVSTASNGTQYTYVVRAMSTSGEGGSSTSVTVTPRIPAPATIRTTTVGDAEVVLRWGRVRGNSTEYRIYRADTGTAARIATVVQTPAIARVYTDTGLTNGTEYTYTVRAVDTNGSESIDSPAISVTPVAAVSDPSDLTGIWDYTDSAASALLKITFSSGNKYTLATFIIIPGGGGTFPQGTPVNCDYTATSSVISLTNCSSAPATPSASYAISGTTLTYGGNDYLKQ